MIRAVLFDNGGVLTEGGKAGSFRQRLAELYGVDWADMDLGGLGDKIFRGTIPTDDFFAELNRRHPDSAPVTSAMFVERASPLFVQSPRVRKLVLALRKAGVRTGIISDAIGAVAEVHQRLGDYDGFDPLLLSCYDGLLKPETALYEQALAHLGLPAAEVLFIDDQKAFLPHARQLGMHTILARSPDQIVDDIVRLFKTENNLELAIQ